ncbi:hypothetical protein SM17_00454 [Klebsiella pneumoniae]|nr:hypothetical protein SM17_00454 [Klebsiella pneumoniae]
MANLYDLKKFDLNLLVIFECIYQHLSISKAAAMLFITPSAVSQSLQRLRQQLNDPLFVRVGKGMTPTTACVNLHYHLQQNLEQLEKTINLNNRSELRKRIVIYGPPLFCSVNSHVMINQLCHQANLQIEHHNLTTTESAEELLAYPWCSPACPLPTAPRSVSPIRRCRRWRFAGRAIRDAKRLPR